MTGRGTRTISALAAVVLAAGLLAACGDSDSGTSSSDSGGAPSSTQASQGAGQDGSARGAEDGNEGSQPGRDEGSGAKDSGGGNPNVDPAPLKVSGGGSAQYRVAGGDNSIQEFGEEADDSELEEAAAALHAYLVARAEERWAAACSQLAKAVKDQLDTLASRSDGLEGKGCAEIMGALTPSQSAAARDESTIVDAGSLRLEDGRAFLIYSGPKGVTYAVLMEEEDGSWKVGALSAIPLS